MQANIFTLPVSLEQLAAVIKRMSPENRKQLLAMVPELVSDVIQQKQMLYDTMQTVDQLKQELLEELDGQLLSLDEPFIEGFTLGQYLELSDAEREKLWDRWGEVALDEIEEVEVHPNALLAKAIVTYAAESSSSLLPCIFTHC